MKRYVRKILSEVLGEMHANGQIRAIPHFTIEVPKEAFGDYTTSVAHAIARESDFLPNDVADIIAREAKRLDARNAFADVSVKNAFVNIRIAPEALAEHVFSLQNEIVLEQSGIDSEGNRKKVNIPVRTPTRRYISAIPVTTFLVWRA